MFKKVSSMTCWAELSFRIRTVSSGGWTRFAKHDGAIDRFELSCNEPSYCAEVEEQKNSIIRAGNNEDGSFSNSCGPIILCLQLNI